MAPQRNDSFLAKGMGAYGAERSTYDAQEVDKIHDQSDLDSRSEAQHHSLGPGHEQAAPGNHSHDGGTSPYLWTGATITGSRGGNMALASVIAALVSKGIVDSTVN